jgi:hypothetical protein
MNPFGPNDPNWKLPLIKTDEWIKTPEVLPPGINDSERYSSRVANHATYKINGNNRDILRCPVESRVAWREHFMRQLKDFHSQEDTCPFLKYLLNEALTQWFREAEGDILVSPISFRINVREVILQQNAIGWRQVVNGAVWEEVGSSAK